MGVPDRSQRLVSGRFNRAQHSDDALAVTLADVLSHGHAVDGSRPNRELIAYAVEVADARDRLLANPAQKLRLVTAVARTVWMLAGNDRLADIAFYEPRVQRFTDDDLIVPGSSYGRRLFRPRPGLNQIEAAIGRLRGENDHAGDDDRLRRAAAVVWEPEDAVRTSHDIPCAFGVFFHARDGVLVTTVVMRSNNAAVLMPWNLFEFSVLAEMVAIESGLTLGPLVHWAASMHVYDANREQARRVIDAARAIAGKRRTPMTPMPAAPSPMAQANKLAQLEASLRHELAAIGDENDDQLLARGSELDPWWQALYRVLLAYCLAKVRRFSVAERIATALPGNFQPEVRDAIEQLRHEQPERHGRAQLRLVPDPSAIDPPLPTEPLPTEPEERLRAIVGAIEADEDRELRWREFDALRDEFVAPVAAREGSFDRADVERALRRFRDGRVSRT